MKTEWQHTSELRQSSLSRARESNRGSKMFTVIKRRKKTQQPSEKMMMENSKKKEIQVSVLVFMLFLFSIRKQEHRRRQSNYEILSISSTPPLTHIVDNLHFFSL